MAKRIVNIPKNTYFQLLGGWKQHIAIRIVIFIVFIGLFYFVLRDPLIPKTFDITIGSTSEIIITSPKQIPNDVATQQAKEEAVKRVEPIYTLVNMNNELLSNRIFTRMEQINADTGTTENEKMEIYRRVLPQLFQDFVDAFIVQSKKDKLYNEPLLDKLKLIVDEQKYQIPEEAYFRFHKLTADELYAMRETSDSIIRKLMAVQISNVQSVRSMVAEQVNASTLTKNTMREAVQEIIRLAITPNKLLDELLTEEARVIAREQVTPIFIQKGDILVQKGEVITPETYEILLNSDLLKTKVSYIPQLGLLLLTGLLVMALFMFIRQSQLPIRTNNVQLVMLLIIYILNMIIIKIVLLGHSLDFPYLGYLVPAVTGIMLIAVLLDAPIAMISSFIFAIVSSIAFNLESEQLFDFKYGFVGLVAGLTAVFAVQKAGQRSGILRAGFLVAIFGSIAIISLFMLNHPFMISNLLFSLAFTLSSGLLIAILVIGIMPFFEVVFRILSPLKLVELSNPNHPLLRKLLTETPGSYHHSLMVGNLSETAAESIGADGLLCRVGSFFHDVGKTKRPSYFIENQSNMENPHDRIAPSLSKSIIIAHAKDGVDMLSDHKIPKSIRDIAEQHHGTTLLKFFYHKAKKATEESGELVEEQDYRYPGPKAQTKEAAIVGIADCVEAAVRSLHSPTIEQINTMVRKIIKDRLDDGQFNECDLTLKELDTIARTLNETLLGIFHSRIEYPEDLPKKSG